MSRLALPSVPLVVVLLVCGCETPTGPLAHAHSVCARCGCSKDVSTWHGKVKSHEMRGTELSSWLATYRQGKCRHQWVSVSGNSESGFYWDSGSIWNNALLRIRELEPSLGREPTKELLAEYFMILDMKPGPEQRRDIALFYQDLEKRTK